MYIREPISYNNSLCFIYMFYIYMELAQMITEAEKSQALQLAISLTFSSHMLPEPPSPTNAKGMSLLIPGWHPQGIKS